MNKNEESSPCAWKRCDRIGQRQRQQQSQRCLSPSFPAVSSNPPSRNRVTEHTFSFLWHSCGQFHCSREQHILIQPMRARARPCACTCAAPQRFVDRLPPQSFPSLDRRATTFSPTIYLSALPSAAAGLRQCHSSGVAPAANIMHSK